MKIGWVRLSQEIEFDYRTATQPGIEERQGLMKELVRAGHRIICFSRIKKSHEPMLDDPPAGLSWLRRVSFDYEGFPREHKCKFLIIEMGPDNMMYEHKPTNEPYIRRMCRVIDGHKGVVFYYHADPLVPFPMDQIVGRKYKWGHKKNGYCNEKYKKGKWVAKSSWGTYDEIFRKKKFVILHRADKLDTYLDVYGSGRTNYREYPIEFRHFPIGVDFAFRRHYRVVRHPKHDVVYAGSDRSRRNSFNRIYGQLAHMGMPIYLTGKWPEDYMAKYPTMKCTGWMPHFWQIDKYVNNSYCTIQIQPDKACRMGWATLRPLEAIAEGVIALYDVATKSSSLPLGANYSIENAEDAFRKIKHIRNMGYSERSKHNALQRSKIRRLTFKNQAAALLSIFEEMCKS